MAISDENEEKEFTFEIAENSTNKEKLDKTFDIAYCEIFYNLHEVRILD